ncbi:MAG: twin-arginine translocase TatA/TatE family subunit [Rikenellaceae bacterium]|jgi:sec-independent protein translocase protein TatA|nr:twin-arginine translocase TatA/TatE family subunit [Rikenellaceae bacterium]
MFQKFGMGEIIFIAALALLFFGGKKIPELMRGLGRGIKEFKDAANKDYSSEQPKASEKIEQSSHE